MADQTTAGSQITDAVTQTNVRVIGEAPAMAMASIYQALAHSTGLMFENAVNAQNQQAILAQAATTQGVMQIYSVDTAADALATAKLFGSGAPGQMSELLTALGALPPEQHAEALAAATQAVNAYKDAQSKPGA